MIDLLVKESAGEDDSVVQRNYWLEISVCDVIHYKFAVFQPFLRGTTQVNTWRNVAKQRIEKSCLLRLNLRHNV
ncbi:hypothetical protein Poly41_15170 [Novipirellula artificiosorum]|uniref:Uncharacterized protein n=1 Tax=Novipirellula artificiosorum TaxID=2528016 RepID=A0A5C6DVS6_9BACT|nr:hypothetical protein Poly41_15170 [Novipirellula artificiosorum]